MRYERSRRRRGLRPEYTFQAPKCKPNSEYGRLPAVRGGPVAKRIQNVEGIDPPPVRLGHHRQGEVPGSPERRWWKTLRIGHRLTLQTWRCACMGKACQGRSLQPEALARSPGSAT